MGVASAERTLNIKQGSTFDPHSHHALRVLRACHPTDLLTIAQIFRTTSYRRLPVLRDEKLVGQVSRRDVLQAAHQLQAIAPNRETALLYLSSLIDRNDAPIA